MAVVGTEEPGRFMVVGFDLGHAETAVATVRADAGQEPVIAVLHTRADDRQVHPTAVARRVEAPGEPARTVVGLACFNILEERVARRPAGAGPDKEMYLAFKSQAIGPGSDARHATELFVERVVRQLSEADPDLDGVAVPPGTRARWVFGAPPGWGRAVRREYQRLLSDVVTKLNPEHEADVIPESLAAMLYVQRLNQMTGSAPGAPPPDLGSVLVVDMGSLTTDYTYVADHAGGDDLWEVMPDHSAGHLGAGLIDRQIMRRIIEQHPNRAVLAEVVGNDSYQRARLELACRQAKEELFSAAGQPGPDGLAGRTVRIKTPAGMPVHVPVRLSSEVIKEILEVPIDLPGGTGEHGWRAAFGRELDAVRAQILERRGALPRIVLLTGGASRMPFAQEMCETAFGTAPGGGPGSRVIPLAEPEYVVARGLAIAGRRQHQIDSFRADVAAFIDADLPLLIRENLEPLAAALGGVMFAGLVEKQLCPAVGRWRDGELDLVTEIGPDVMRARSEYLAGPEGREQVRGVQRAWYDQITRVINQETQRLANKHGIAADSLRISPLFLDATPDAYVDATAVLAPLRVLANVTATVTTLVSEFIALVLTAAMADAAVTAGGAAAATGVGLIFGAVVGVGVWRAKGRIVRAADHRRIPGPMRKIVTKNYVLRKVREKAGEDQLEEKGALEFAKTFAAESGQAIEARIAGRVRNELKDAARRAERLINRGTP